VCRYGGGWEAAWIAVSIIVASRSICDTPGSPVTRSCDKSSGPSCSNTHAKATAIAIVRAERRNLQLREGIERSGNAWRPAHAAQRRLNALGGTRSLLSKPSNGTPRPVRGVLLFYSTVPCVPLIHGPDGAAGAWMKKSQKPGSPALASWRQIRRKFKSASDDPKADRPKRVQHRLRPEG
jgi:plasmid stabilization system protein ParE